MVPILAETLTFPQIRSAPSDLHNTSIPGTQLVQALAGIPRSALCCHSNETRAPIANPPNSSQLEGTPTTSPTYIQIRAVVWECGEGQTHRQTDTQTHRRP